MKAVFSSFGLLSYKHTDCEIHEENCKRALPFTLFGSIHLLETLLILFSLYQVLGRVLAAPWAKKLQPLDVPRQMSVVVFQQLRRDFLIRE
jgi:hypothetical protein